MAEEFTQVFVKGFGRKLTDGDLKLWFEKHCKGVKHAEVAKDYYGKSLDYGSVSFSRQKYAEAALRNADVKNLNGKFLKVAAYTKSKAPAAASNKNVFVKGFGDTLDKKELRIYFRDNVGDVQSAEVAKDDNGTSRGYGYVSFYKCEDAAKAVRKINGRTVHGKTLSVEFFKPREQRSREPIPNVYVEGLDEIIDNEDLKDLFEIFGKIQSAKVAKNFDGTSSRHGYVCFSRIQDAETAIRIMNGYRMDSNELKVCPFRSKEERQKDLKNRNLHIKNLHKSVNDEELKEIFQPYGDVLSVRINASPIFGINQGNVSFKTVEEADDAIDALNNSLYKGLKLQVCVHRTKEKPIGETVFKEERNSTFSKRKPREHPELSGNISGPNSKKNIHKFRSLGNLNRSKGNSRIAANFGQTQSHKSAEKDTNAVYSGERHSQVSTHMLGPQGLNQSYSESCQSRQVKTSPQEKKVTAGKSVLKAPWNVS